MMRPHGEITKSIGSVNMLSAFAHYEKRPLYTQLTAIEVLVYKLTSLQLLLSSLLLSSFTVKMRYDVAMCLECCFPT
jgi:hypothetical protein